MTGLYCPGCGGTRSLHALLEGHPLRSLLYHPIVLYGCLAFAAGIFLTLRYYLSRPGGHTKTTPKRFFTGALIGAAILLLFHYVIRNILLMTGLPSMP